MTKKNNNNDKRSFVFYDSFLEAMKHLNDAEFRECVMRIRDYALENIDEQSDSPMVNIILALVKPNLDSARRRYEASVENGKKGAEFGKLGGAPKGNQNARKKQPLNQPQKQPLDVYVEEDVNEEVDVNEDTPVGDIVPFSSFSNSSSSVLSKEIESDSERLEEREKKKEPLQEVRKEEASINPKMNSNNISSDSTASDQGVIGVAARPQQQKEPGMDMSEYIERCFVRGVSKLANIRRGKLPQDDNLFWRTVDYYCDLYGDTDKSTAAKNVSKIIAEFIKQGIC